MSTKKLTKKKKKQRKIIMFFFAFIFTLTGIILSLTVFFKITDVVVEGDMTIYTPQQVKEIADIKTGTNLFRINAKDKENRIWSTLPYIKNVEVRRKLPGTIVIHVEEAKTLLCVQSASGYIVMSDNLKVLDIATVPQENMIVVSGLVPVDPEKGAILVVENTENAAFLQKLINLLDEAALLDQVTAIDVSDKLNYTMVYANRLSCMIGTANNLDYKIKMLEEVITDELSETDVGFVDLSTAGKAVFKPGKLDDEVQEQDESGLYSDNGDVDSMEPDDSANALNAGILLNFCIF